MSANLPDSERLRIRETMALFPASGGSVLDAGCGDGRLLDRLPNEVVIGIDVDPEKLSACRRPVVRGSIHALPFSTGSFDTVVCAEVLEHLPDSLVFLAADELQRVARTTLVVTVPWEEDLMQATTRCNQCGRSFHLSGHLRSFTSKRLSAAFPQFVVEAVCTFGKRTEYESYVFARLMRMFGGRWPVPARGLVCQSCGSSNVGSEGNAFAALIAHFHWRWCSLLKRCGKDYWIGMRLVRKTESGGGRSRHA